MKTYKIVRQFYENYPNKTIKRGLTLEQAQAHCSCPETSSRTCKKARNIKRTEDYGMWFDSYTEEK